MSIPPFGPHRALCFYPSSGHRLLCAVMRLDCDLFVMAEKRPKRALWDWIEANFARRRRPVERIHASPRHLAFRSEGKEAWIFFEDNNLTLKRISDAGLRIAAFVGICDGCREGGNLECVHERPFLRRLLPLADNGMRYFTDHSDPLQDHDRNRQGWLAQPHPYYCQRLRWRDFPAARNFRHRPELIEPFPMDDGRADDLPRTFELQGLLVRNEVEEVGPPTPASRAFRLLKTGSAQTEVEKLRPFRSMLGREILAEYRVWHDPAVSERTQERDVEPAAQLPWAMAGFEDRNRVRMWAAIDGFRVRHGRWPTRVRMSPAGAHEIEASLRPAELAVLVSRIALVREEGVGMVAEDDGGASYDYGREGFPPERPDPPAEEWLTLPGAAASGGDPASGSS